MTQYIDGFVLPIPHDRLEEYQRQAAAVAMIWKEHGALDYREYVGDDMHLEGTAAFTNLAKASHDEVVIFGWVLFESREARDQAHAKVATDPRVAELIDPVASGFDASRMAFGGFRPLV